MTFEVKLPPSDLQIEAAAAAMAAVTQEIWGDRGSVTPAHQARVLRRCADIVEGSAPANATRGLMLLAAQSLAPTPGAGGEAGSESGDSAGPLSPAVVATSPGEGPASSAPLPGPADPRIVAALARYRSDDGNAAQAGLDLAVAVWEALPEEGRGPAPNEIDEEDGP